ncbi:mammalian cell entry protein [Mycobacterium sp. M1]|uniref:Mammalian cell entry protein n=1 Tax=Mycolicibacter acidiphilus TaxID=2835306 RepID=A0ABS5RN10_9MYCO|nr:mammalian cell entry protein [Mycolicibacter acidiphilus]MBS9535698.1 mammalian cell entry protein [Mycolicibacter acidiphilus]
MEDQQPDPGALTEPSEDALEDANEDATEAAEEALEDDDEAGEADETDGEAAETDEPEDAEPEPTVAKPPSKWRSGRVLVAVAAALFVAASGFSGSAVQPYLSDRAEVATKLQITRTAIAAITTLWNYTPENMDTLADRASGYLSGDLQAQYRKLIDGIAEANKQAKVTNSTEITGAAVESLQGREATVLVYMNTTGTSEAQKGLPSLKYLTYRLFMKRDNNRWVVTRMPTVTSLSLTPRM